MSPPDPREWLYLRIALGAVALIAVADVVAWKVHETIYPPPTRLEQTVRCLKDEMGVEAVVPAGDPLSATAGDGSFRATVQGNGLIVALASTVEEASAIESNYRRVGGELTGRLERRDRTVYLWESPSLESQRRAMSECRY